MPFKVRVWVGEEDELEMLDLLWSAELDKISRVDLPALYDGVGSRSCLGFLLIWRLRGGTLETGSADSCLSKWSPVLTFLIYFMFSVIC